MWLVVKGKSEVGGKNVSLNLNVKFKCCCQCRERDSCCRALSDHSCASISVCPNQKASGKKQVHASLLSGRTSTTWRDCVGGDVCTSYKMQRRSHKHTHNTGDSPMYSLLLKRCIRSSAKTWRGIRLMMKTYPPHADTCNTRHVLRYTHKKKKAK